MEAVELPQQALDGAMCISGITFHILDFPLMDGTALIDIRFRRNVTPSFLRAVPKSELVHKYCSQELPLLQSPLTVLPSMIFSTFATILVSALGLVSAIPTQKYYGCDVSGAELDLPDTKGISIPNGVKPEYIVLGIGTQNYTCTKAGNYTSAGAVATLIDISCLYESNPKLFEDVQDYAYNLFPMYGHSMPTWHKIEAVIGHYPHILGDHYFIPNGGAISPKFDFRRSQKGDESAFTVDKRVGGIPSPEGSSQIDWLHLENTAGNLSKYTFRVDTHGGQPPKSCYKEGHTITVPYTAKYWFFK